MIDRSAAFWFLLLVGFHASACQSSRGHSTIKSKDSGPINNSVSIVSDSDWELRLMNEIPKEPSPDHIRCNPSGHCWLWNVDSIWLADNTVRWRQVYILPPEQRKELDN